MVLVDTSVWIAHLRGDEAKLAPLLDRAEVYMHPFVLGELACGNLKNRAVLLNHLTDLPHSAFATYGEAIYLVEHRRIWGRGVGWTDVNLLASALLTGCPLWTFDASLRSACQDAGVRAFQTDAS